VTLDLSSVHAKLGRGEDLARAVEDEIRAWQSTNPYSISYETNADSTRYSAIFHVHNLPQAERWSLMIADSIHNFRCVLDHLVYAIAVHEFRADPPPYADELMFPICDTNERFEREIKRHRLGDISSPMRAVVELFQPYNRSYPKLPPILAMLRDFENVNKHKLLQVVFSAVSAGNIGFTGPPFCVDDCRVVIEKGEIKDGTEIVAVIFDRPHPNMKFDRMECTVVLALTHKLGIGGISNRDDCTALVNLIRDEINSVVNAVSGNVV